MAVRKSRRLRRNLRKSRRYRNKSRYYRGGGPPERVFDVKPHINKIFKSFAEQGGDLVTILDTYITQNVKNGEDQYKLSQAVIGEVNKLEELPNRNDIIAQISPKYPNPNPNE